MKQSLLKLFVTAFVAAITAVGAMAQIPHDYYQSLSNSKKITWYKNAKQICT